jgi:hypothetical protein
VSQLADGGDDDDSEVILFRFLINQKNKGFRDFDFSGTKSSDFNLTIITNFTVCETMAG